MHQTYKVTAWILASCLLTLGAPPGEAAQAASVLSENAAAADAAPGGPSDDWGWPRPIQSGDTTITLYQPQLDAWSGNQLSGRAAVAMQSSASSSPTYGVIWFSARTAVDKQAGTVTLDDYQITKSSLPSGTGAGPDSLQLIRQNFGTVAGTLPIAQLEADLTITQAEKQQRRQPLRNDPPRILFSTTPAVLALIDGQPALRQVAGTDLLRVINTRALILLDRTSGSYYLGLADRWMQASSLQGPWTPAAHPPASLDKAKQALVAAEAVDLLSSPSPAVAGALSSGIVPTVYVSTTPAELLQTDGAPDFEPIDGTNLLWARNSTASIFMDVADQSHYVLISGRWFRSKSLTDGTWSYVPGASLPRDFAQIPATHPAGDALPAVPGTPQARQALIAQSIPQTAAVRRDTARLTVTYDGEPKFGRIQGTSLTYVVNTPTPVIRVDRQTYYACDNGVWFRSGSPEGPWVVATSVPGVIYTIPISSPLNYVTNVVVYDATPEVVYVGYTPGYLGTYVADDDCIVFGSGYRYRPWIGNAWFGWPITYGLGVGFDWDDGFGWEWGFGWGLGPVWSPWWGPWWGHWRDWDLATGRRLRPRRPNDLRTLHAVNLNHFNIYNHWNRGVVAEREPLRGPRPGSLLGNPGRVPGFGIRPGAGSSNLFAGRDGYVYRRGEGGWEVRDGSEWRGIGAGNPAARAPQPGATPSGPSESSGQLYRDQVARSLSGARGGARQPDVGTAPGASGERPPSDLGGPRSGLSRPAPDRGAFGGFGRRGGFGGGAFGGGGRRR